VLKSHIHSGAAPQLVSGGSGLLTDRNGHSTLMHEERFVKLFDELRIPLSRYLRRIGLSREEAEEIVQDVFLCLFKHLSKKGGEENLPGWVFRVAHNLAVNQYKHQRCLSHLSQQEWVKLSEMLIDKAPNPEQRLIGQDKIAEFGRAICVLSHRQLECFFLRMKGYRYREIAEILGITVTTVAETLHRAIKKLQGDGKKSLENE
jgi:RNA polymerase sigma-70 factor, ECF subfamily